MFFIRMMIALGAICFVCVTANPASADDWFDCKYGLEDGSLPDEGIQGCTRIIRSGRESVHNLSVAYGNRCGHYVHKKEYDSALRDCNRSIELNPNNSGAYNWRGIVYNRKDMQDKAFSDFTSSINTDPNDGVAYSNRAGIWYRRGNKELAFDDYNKAVALSPKDGRMWCARASYFVSEKQFDAARRDLAKAKALGKEAERIAYVQGRLAFALHDYRAALREFTEAAGPEMTYAYKERARVHMQLSDLDAALSDMDSYINYEPKDVAGYETRANIHERRGDYASAAKDYTQVLRFGTRNADRLNSLAWALVKSNQSAKALPYAEEALKLEPNDANIIDTRAHVYEALGRTQEAIADYRRAISIRPDLIESRKRLLKLGTQ